MLAVYVAAGKLGLALAIIHKSASPVWPPTGIALAALLVLGYRIWPAILVGAFLVNVTEESIATSLAIAVGNTLEGLLAAFLVNRFAGGAMVFARAPDILRFIVLALLSCTVSATIGVTSLALAGSAEWPRYGSIWLTWWLGDATGALTVAPALILWGQNRAVRWPRSQALEGLLLLLTTILVGLLVFNSGLLFREAMNYPVAFVTLPATIWAAYRFGPREAATLILVLSGIATWGTLGGDGPFAVGSQNESLLLLQAFLATVAGSSLTLAAVVAERRRVEEERQQLLQAEHRARGDAEEANRAKDEFLAMLSHELRTPLNAMLGWATLLRTGRLDAPAQGHALEVIERNVKLQTKLIDDLLDVSRIVAGKLRIDRHPIELAPVVESAVEAARPTAAAKSIRLELSMDSATGRVSGDAARLQQIVSNLVSNAVKFTDGGGRVSVWLGRVGAHVHIRVSDTGKGIAPELLPRIFERFHQAESASTRLHGGLGLGLAIVRQLVELHGGRVGVESPGAGKGATFTVELPVATAESSSRASGAATRGDTGPSLAGLRVLAVDDDADARHVVSAVLETYGAEATVVSSAAEALDALGRAEFDVLVADIAMPGQDGYELIDSVRARETGGRRIPAVALTAFARREDADRALATGYDAHLVKPVEPRRLADAVAALTRQGR